MEPNQTRRTSTAPGRRFVAVSSGALALLCLIAAVLSIGLYADWFSVSQVQSWSGKVGSEGVLRLRTALSLLAAVALLGWGGLSARKAFAAGARRAGWWCAALALLAPLGVLTILPLVGELATSIARQSAL